MSKLVRKEAIYQLITADGKTDWRFYKYIIRCKECKYQYFSEIDELTHCLLPNGYTPLGDDDDFCSYAERKEDDD